MTDHPANDPAVEADEALEQPLSLLHEALLCIADARQIMAADERGGSTADPLDQAMFRIETANALRGIADVAARIDSMSYSPAPVPASPGVSLAEPSEPSEPVRYTPQAVQGVRFTATLSDPEDGAYVGWVAGRRWLYVDCYGFVDISEASETVDDSGMSHYTLAGRIVSQTPGYMLGITDGGVGVTVPRKVVQETPEDRR
jgi:hypothetical protein